MMLAALAGMVFALRSDPLLDDVQKRAVQFFWNESDARTGFTKDRALNTEGKTDNYTIASCAATGYAFIAYAIGVEHKWLDRKQALQRTRATLKHLNNDWEQSHGWLYHFVDWKSGERVWKCEASSVDTSLCLAGILFAEKYWNDPEVSAQAQAFENRIDWKWMLTDGGKRPDETHYSMGWHPESGFISNRWSQYNEAKFLYIQAYGLNDLTAAGWDTLNRPQLKYQGIDYIAGGPIFMHQMSEVFYDFRGKRDRLGYDYEIASHNACLGNRQYCIDNPKHFKGYGPDFWGLNASDGPDGYNAFGAPGWIDDNGTVCPTGAVAAITVLPQEALSFAHHMRSDYPNAWGKYGFPDSVNPTRSWTDTDVIGIDLGMMLCGTENYRSELIWRINNANPVIQKGMDRAGLKRAPADSRLKI
jgi:hypothetical protein